MLAVCGPAARTLAAAAPDELLLLDVSINGQDRSETLPVLRRNGGLFVRLSDAKAWRLKLPAGVAVSVDGTEYLPLAALKGARSSIDGPRQLLRLDVPVEDFETTVLSPTGARVRAPLTTPVRAAFASYDVSLEQIGGHPEGAAFLQAGISDSWGLLTSSATLSNGAGLPGAARLDTYYQYDDPDRLTRLTLGDGTTRGSDWIQPIRFGGVRYGSEFDLQPNLVTFPTPSFYGRTTLPSNVELYVNNALQFQGDVDPGPFSVNQVPLVTGAGQVTLMVHDALGVEQQVTSAYYISSGLLKQGLTDFSLEAGMERGGYGLRSFDYQDPFAAGSYRQGINDHLTGEGRLELGARVQDVGAGAVALWPAVGEFGLDLSASNSEGGAGALARFSFNRLTPVWNVSVIYERATDSFRQIGTEGQDEQVREQLQASAGVSLKKFGSLGLAFTSLTLGDEGAVRVTSFNYGLPIGRRAFLNLFLLDTQARGQKSSATLGFGLTVPFGQRSSVYAQYARRDSDVEYRTTPPTDQGWGYRLAYTDGVQSQEEADLTWRSQAGEVTGEVAHAGGSNAYRLLADGGLILIGGKVTPTRQLDSDGFGIVDVPDSPNVGIYQENRLVAHTDANGAAVLTELRPYDRNKISLDPAALPLETELETDVLYVTPRFFGGVLARFNVQRERPATVVVKLESGALLEAGVPVSVQGQKEQLFSGYDGEVFVSVLRQGMVLEVQRAAGRCRVTVDTVSKGVLPRVGPLVCKTSGATP